MVEKICWLYLRRSVELSLLAHSGWNFLVDKPPHQDKVSSIEGVLQVQFLPVDEKYKYYYLLGCMICQLVEILVRLNQQIR